MTKNGSHLKGHLWCVLALALSLCTSPAFGDTIHVPGDQPTIQAGVAAVLDGDTVLVAAGTYSENINFLGKAITVRSESGPQTTIISGNDNPEVVTFDSGEGPDSILQGFTVRYGTNCGIGCSASDPTIADCIITNNTATGICMSGSSATVTNCVIENNEGIYGGGIYCWDSDPTIDGCVIRNNTVDDYGLGGGIFLMYYSSPTITNCVIRDNTAGHEGFGGGLYVAMDSSAAVTNCVISKNTAFDGGGICIDDLGGIASAAVTNCTITRNKAEGQGGGICCYGSGATVVNSILWANTAGGGPNEMYFSCGTSQAITYSDIRGGWAGTGNIASDPLFVDPGSGDFHLQPSSLCVDTGNNSAVPAGVTTDFEGDLRIVDGDGNSSVVVDMGADEYDPDVLRANFAADPTIGTRPLAVDFTDYSTGSPTTWLWDFGDGGSSIVKNSSYTYMYLGDFTVSLTVNDGSDTRTKEYYVHVREHPILNSVTPASGGYGQSIHAYGNHLGNEKEGLYVDLYNGYKSLVTFTHTTTGETWIGTIYPSWSNSQVETRFANLFQDKNGNYLRDPDERITPSREFKTRLGDYELRIVTVCFGDKDGSGDFSDGDMILEVATTGPKIFNLTDWTVVSTVWAKTYGDGSVDYLSSVQQTVDGGYVVAGTADSFGLGWQDFWATKLDSEGNVIWEKVFPTSANDWASCVQETFNHLGPDGYVVAGTRLWPSNGQDAWVIKLDLNGNVIWEKTYDLGASEHASTIRQVADGGYIVAGLTADDPGIEDVWIIKLNPNGSIAWHKTYGGDEWESASAIEQTKDGGYIVAGRTASFGLGGTNAWIIKINPDGHPDGAGSIAWEKFYGGGESDSATSVQETFDQSGQPDGYIVAGGTDSFGLNDTYDMWILRLNLQGQVVWQKTYGGGEDHDSAGSIQQTEDGGFVVSGTTRSFGAGDSDIWLLKLDFLGNVTWQRTYGGSHRDAGSGILQTLDGGYVLVGYTESYGGPDGGPSSRAVGWILKLDSDGQIGDCGIVGTSQAIVDDTWVIGQATTAAVQGPCSTVSETGVSPQDSWAVTYDVCSPPIADFSGAPTSGDKPLEVTFTDASTSIIETWSWDFGDGDTSSDQNPSHTYAVGGDFTVILTVTGPGGQDTETKVAYIHVVEPQAPYISQKIKPRPCERGEIVRIVGYNFGDTQGDSSVHIGPTKVYGPGHPKIKLWTDTKIKIKVPNYDCSKWVGKDVYLRKVWVTVNGVDSNKKRIRIMKPATCQ